MPNPFDNISVKNQEKLLKILEANTYKFKKNSSILPIIKEDNMLGIVLNGYIQIIRIDHNGNRTIIEEINEMEIFGSSISSLKNTEYEIIVKEDSEIIIIDYKKIINQNDEKKDYYNQFIRNILNILIIKMKEKNERIEILTKKTIRNKLLEYFKIERNKHGSNFIYLPFNFIDLADYLGVDRCAMSREMKYLKEEGLIEIKGKRITLLYNQDKDMKYL